MTRSGLELLCDEDFARFAGQKLALLTHPASVDAQCVHALRHFEAAQIDLRLLLGPEHGLTGHAQDMETVEENSEVPSGPDVLGLYGDSLDSLRPPLAALSQVDRLVVDLQDIGARYYTYAVTMRYCMEVCAEAGVAVTVLDRPNPIGGHLLEGPALQHDFRSFVGGFSMPVRHGLSLGELALLARAEGVDVELDLLRMQGWSRGMWFDDCGLPWVMPSPNMPTLATATVYPGACLLEATNLSEGRGTTRPFELLGAPWLDGQALASSLNDLRLAGVVFRPCSFTPTFQKHAGQLCHGLQIHVTDREEFAPFLTGALILQAMRRQNPERFAWRKEPYEFVSHMPAIDMLSGSPDLRLCIEADEDVRDLEAGWKKDCAVFAEQRADLLQYD